MRWPVAPHNANYRERRAGHGEKGPAVSDAEDLGHVGTPVQPQLGLDSLILPDCLLYEVEPGVTGLNNDKVGIVPESKGPTD